MCVFCVHFVFLAVCGSANVCIKSVYSFCWSVYIFTCGHVNVRVFACVSVHLCKIICVPAC